MKKNECPKCGGELYKYHHVVEQCWSALNEDGTPDSYYEGDYIGDTYDEYVRCIKCDQLYAFNSSKNIVLLSVEIDDAPSKIGLPKI